MPLPVLIVALLGIATLIVLAAYAWADATTQRRVLDERDAIQAHWESLVMRRRDLRLAVDAAGIATLHGRAGGTAYTIRIGDGEGPLEGRPLAEAPGIAAGFALSVVRRGERSFPYDPAVAIVGVADEGFDAVYELRSDDAERARAVLSEPVRAAMLVIPGAFVALDAEGLRIDLGDSPMALDDALLDALGTVIRAFATAAPPAVAAG